LVTPESKENEGRIGQQPCCVKTHSSSVRFFNTEQTYINIDLDGWLQFSTIIQISSSNTLCDNTPFNVIIHLDGEQLYIKWLHMILSMSDTNDMIVIGSVDDIPQGKMKHVEVKGKEIVIANVGGKFYAMDDRCGHMNALLSMGSIAKEGIVTCPFHGASFDVTTGRKTREPILTPSQEMEPLPEKWQNYMENVGQLMSHIRTYDQQAYETKVDGDLIKIKVSTYT
jgi:nitrite reductase/ring-hydroxylating ferredoxin subunit